MFKTIAKIAGIYAVVEVAFHLGEGYTIGMLNVTHPEVGAEFHDAIEAGIEDKAIGRYRRAMFQLVLIGEEMGNIRFKKRFEE